jgi:hypothetical protein
MSLANPLWGAPRIHGELLKLGVDVGQTSVAKYMVRGRPGPSQGWRTFLCNHADVWRIAMHRSRRVMGSAPKTASPFDPKISGADPPHTFIELG